MNRHTLLLWTALIISAIALASGSSVSATPPRAAPTPTPTPKPPTHVATPEELLVAQTQWSRSGHADTYDDGMGANTTCANCKAPRNWDPHAPAQEAAHDYSACKREPGKPRPDLTGGVPVSKQDWKNIACDICHEPVGKSYSTALSFWNQNTNRYEAISTSAALCAKCHIEQHGFQVIYEQTASSAHKGWDCTRCHGSHNSPIKCTDCHDPTQGRGTAAHAQHTKVDCTTCHDAGGLTVWQDPYPDSRYTPNGVNFNFSFLHNSGILGFTVSNCCEVHYDQNRIYPRGN